MRELAKMNFEFEKFKNIKSFMEDGFQRVTGFPYRTNEIVDIQKEKAYGFFYSIIELEYVNEIKRGEFIGSFNYLLGICQGLMTAFEDSETHKLLTVFYELEGNLTTSYAEMDPNPIRVIHHARITGDLIKESGDFFTTNQNDVKHLIRRDLTNIDCFDHLSILRPINFADNF